MEIKQHVIITFDDANFKQYLVDNFDRDGDGEISLDEAKDVRLLTLNFEIGKEAISAL